METIDDIIMLVLPFILVTTIVIGLLCIPISIYCDYKIKNRALDIYEDTGILVNIDIEDIIQEGEK